MGKKVVEAKEALKAIHSGMDDQALMEKFQLSAQGLQSLLDGLVSSGLVRPEEIESRTPLQDRTLSVAIHRCPACSMPQLEPFDECPQCGIIVSKFTKAASDLENMSGRQHYHDVESRATESPVSSVGQAVAEQAANLGDQQNDGAPQLRGVLWKFRTDGLGVTAPAIGGKGLCFGGSDCTLRCIAIESRVEWWRFKTGSPINAAPVIHDGRVYFGTLGGTFYAVELNSGHEKWRFSASGPIYASARVHGQLVYFGDFEGNLYALEASSGDLWSSFALGQAIRSTPVISGGRIYVGCNDGHLYAID